MNSKTAVILVFLAIIILGGTLVLMNRKTTNSTVIQTAAKVTPTPGLPKETAVTLSEKDGFTPKTVAIKVGNAVTWTNSDIDKATINSDDHPTHRKFPEMNLGQFQKGQSLAHIFTKAGTYTYHDHYNPSFKGTVVVE